jgi:hypothetical protein
MARSTPATITPTAAGAVATPTAPDATGDIIDPGGILLVIAGATPTTVTIQTTRKVSGLSVGNGGGTVAANTARAFVLNASLYKQAADAVAGANKVLVDYSSVATITRTVLAG